MNADEARELGLVRKVVAHEQLISEAIAYAEQIGVPADTLAPFRKPGKSKAQAIEVINGHIAAATAA